MKLTGLLFLLGLMAASPFFSHAQDESVIAQPLGVKADGTAPDTSAMLDIQSTARGVLIPRLTTAQRQAVTNPATGLLVFDSDSLAFYFYGNGGWVPLIDSGSTLWKANGSDIFYNDGGVGIGSTNPDGKLTVEDGAVLFSGTTGGTPVSGAGTRLMWIPSKAAFRAGLVDGSQWDDGNIGFRSFVGGGEGNTANAFRAFIGGGSNNTVSETNGFIGGGLNNQVVQNSASIVGGSDNYVSGVFAMVGGGSRDTASGTAACVVGGQDNRAGVSRAFIGGGSKNKATGGNSFVGGGTENRATANNSFVGGGQGNRATSFYAFVGGGRLDTASGEESFVAGGFRNHASGTNSFVGGGNRNKALNTETAILGGDNNHADGFRSAIAGGIDNSATSNNAFVGGGNNNTSTEWNSAAIGGLDNTASGRSSVVAGGQDITAASFAEAVFGTFNTDYVPASQFLIDSNDRLFVIGNGTSDVARANALTVLKNGNFGFGTEETPDFPIHLGSGAHVTHSGVWTNASDISRKENLRPLPYGLHTLLQLNPLAYDYKIGHDSSIGFTAQEMEKLIPEVVSGPEGNKGIAYGLLNAVIVKAMQEQQSIIEAQREMIENQEKRISAQERELKAQEERIRRLERLVE